MPIFGIDFLLLFDGLYSLQTGFYADGLSGICV